MIKKLVSPFLIAFFIFSIISISIVLNKESTRTFIKGIQVTSRGVLIITLEEKNKKEALMVLDHSQLDGKVYSGNVVITKELGKYSFRSLDE